MSTPMKAQSLPKCPVPSCGKAPKAALTELGRYWRGCLGDARSRWHEVFALGRTQAEADARWRRLAGGAK